MKHLFIDNEQEVIIRQALAGVVAFLEARASRRDPFGLITKAYKLQERKCSNLDFQLQQPPLAAWRDIPIDAQGQFEARLKTFIETKSAAAREVHYTQLLAFMLAQRAEPKIETRLQGHVRGEISK